MELKIAQAIGLNTDQTAALVLSSVSEDGQQFLATLKLTCDDAFTRGRQVLAEIEDFYHENDGTVAKKLTDSFAHAKEKLADTEKFDLCLAIIAGKVLYFIMQGEVSVFLKRSEKLSPLSQVAKEQIVSGFLQEKDRVFFATNSLVNFFGENLNRSLSLPVTEWEEDTNSKIGAVHLDDQGLAGLVVDISSEAGEDMGEAQEIGSVDKITSIKTSRNIPNPLAIFGVAFSKLKRIKFSKLIPQSNKARLILGLLLVGVLLIGVGMQYMKAKDEEKQRVFNGYLDQAKSDFMAAEGLQSLNPVETKNKLESAKVNLDKALQVFPSNSEAKDLKARIEQDGASMVQQFAAANFPLFLDLSLVKTDLKAERLSLSGLNLLILDPSTKTLVTIDTAKKSNKILAGKDAIGDAQVASINGSFAFVYSLDKGILKVDSANQKVTTVAKLDKDLEAVDIAGFASNVYLLEPSKNQIWKYLATTDGYSEKREYLTKETKADFSGAIRMQIESSIYVLKSGGEILRFTKGNKDTFSVSGLNMPLKDPKSIFVSSDTDNLYVLDSGNNRLVVLDKVGVYKAEYQGDKFGIASDLAVDEKSKKVYLLDGSKIYSMDLK